MNAKLITSPKMKALCDSDPQMFLTLIVIDELVTEKQLELKRLQDLVAASSIDIETTQLNEKEALEQLALADTIIKLAIEITYLTSEIKELPASLSEGFETKEIINNLKIEIEQRLSNMQLRKSKIKSIDKDFIQYPSINKKV